MVVGCFDPPVELATEGSTGPSTSESGAPPPEPTPPEGSTSTGTTGDASESSSSSSDDGSTSSTSGTDGTSETTAAVVVDEESSSGQPCGFELPALLWAGDATITDPMSLSVVPILPGTPLMARSYAAEAGTVAFELELSCPTELFVFGLVWDQLEGAEPQNADSFFVTVDGLPMPEPVWAYGCQTTGLGDESWSWLPLTAWTGMGCDADPYDVVLDAGPHEIRLRNREAGGGIDAAAIVAIAITDDPGFDPSTLYDPAGP